LDTRSIVTEIIFKALRQLNDELAQGKKIEISTDTKLFGPEASLDSLSLVSVVVDVETGVSDSFSKTVSLTDDIAMSQQVLPFSSVQALVDYIIQLLDKE